MFLLLLLTGSLPVLYFYSLLKQELQYVCREQYSTPSQIQHDLLHCFTSATVNFQVADIEKLSKGSTSMLWDGLSGGYLTFWVGFHLSDGSSPLWGSSTGGCRMEIHTSPFWRERQTLTVILISTWPSVVDMSFSLSIKQNGLVIFLYNEMAIEQMDKQYII